MTSSARGSLHNFKGYGAVDLGDDDQRDDEDELESSYLGMDITPAINTALPNRSYTLRREHPYATDFLSAEERDQLDACKKILRDDVLFKDLFRMTQTFWYIRFV